MIESLKSAAAINATLFAMQGVEPAKDQGQADAAPLRQPEPQMSEAATLSAAIQRLISERDSHKSSRRHAGDGAHETPRRER